MSVLKSPTLAEMPAGGAIYMVFKYIPDMARMEPRNIGVLLWKDGAIAAKFIQETPKFVTSENAYKQWISYWSTQLQKHELPSMAGTVPVASPKFLEALQEGSKGNFYLALGGQIIDNVEDVHDGVNYLFNMLVL
jgi:hypothetical protein